MSPRLLTALGVFLLAVGLALPIVAVSKRGAPWGFRGHRGVFLEAAGDAQLSDKDGNRKDALQGAWLEVGDELRAGRFSIARAKLPEGTLAVLDSGVVRVTDKGLLFSSGALDVVVPAGPGRMTVEVEGFESSLLVRPGGGDAAVHVLADGRGVAYAHVRAGSVEAGGVNVETGQVLTLQRGQAPKAVPAPSAVTLTAACNGAVVSVTTGPGVQVFVPGFARVSDGSPLSIDVPAGAAKVIVSARDVAGNAARPQEVACAKAEPTPAPRAPAPKPVPGGLLPRKPATP